MGEGYCWKIQKKTYLCIPWLSFVQFCGGKNHNFAECRFVYYVLVF